jgi:hypothetical protein
VLSNTLDIGRRIPLNAIATVVVLTGMIFLSKAYAGDSTSQSTMSKRQTIAQMVDCMRKRMSSNKAMKACKDQMKESDNSPSGALVASDTPPKP